jgi:DNA-binding transcriptional regulator YiaG
MKRKMKAKKEFHYTAIGLDNVILVGLKESVDDNGDDCITIPHINELHRAIAKTIITRESGMSGKELKFLRTEMGMTQAELGKIVSREGLAIGRWERGEIPIEPNAEAIIRIVSSERLKIDVDAPTEEISAWCVQAAGPNPITIDASYPTDYRPLKAA